MMFFFLLLLHSNDDLLQLPDVVLIKDEDSEDSDTHEEGK